MMMIYLKLSLLRLLVYMLYLFFGKKEARTQKRAE
jgi:hypothetical protein